MQLHNYIGQIIEFQPEDAVDDDRLRGTVLRVEDGVAIVQVQERNKAEPDIYRVTASQVTGTGFD